MPEQSTTTILAARIDPALKAEFLRLVKHHDTDASKVIRSFVRTYIRENPPLSLD